MYNSHSYIHEYVMYDAERKTTLFQTLFQMVNILNYKDKGIKSNIIKVTKVSCIKAACASQTGIVFFCSAREEQTKLYALQKTRLVLIIPNAKITTAISTSHLDSRIF